MAGLWLFMFLVVVNLESVVGEFCSVYSSWGASVRTFHCTFGCCGSPYDQYCCSGNVGLISGIVFGGIIFIAIVFAVVCCCIKHVTHRGRVIHPSTTAGSYVGNHTTHANIFVVSAGTAEPFPYSVSHANTQTHSRNSTETTTYGYEPGRGVPNPPAYSQAWTPLPPSYNQAWAPLPPAYSQTGVTLPPSNGQTEILQPPAYNHPGVPPPTYSK